MPTYATKRDPNGTDLIVVWDIWNDRPAVPRDSPYYGHKNAGVATAMAQAITDDPAIAEGSREAARLIIDANNRQGDVMDGYHAVITDAQERMVALMHADFSFQNGIRGVSVEGSIKEVEVRFEAILNNLRAGCTNQFAEELYDRGVTK